MVSYAKINKDHESQLTRCIDGKTISFRWKEGFIDLKLKISIPSLKDSKYTVWGDWGPTYTFELNPEKQIEIQYSPVNTINHESYLLENTKLYLESPMIGKIRDQQPLFYIIEDRTKGVTYHIFMDKAGTPNEVKILRNKDKVILFETTEVSQVQ